MDKALLRGITVPSPKCQPFELSDDLQKIKYYSNLNSFIPPMKQLFHVSSNVIFENDYVITNVEIQNEENIKGNCNLEVLYKGVPTKIEGYLKVTHLIDPIQKLQNDSSSEEEEEKINDPWNQAYVETVASYALGKLKKENISPHFNLFYGAFTSIAKTYNYNISEEVDSYKMYRWFWDSIENNTMKINVQGEDTILAKEIYDEIMIKPEYCIDTTNETETEELFGDVKNESYEVKSLDSASIQTKSTITTIDSEDSDDEEGEYEVFVTIENFPVMMIFTEKNESTMDDLLENYEEVGAEPNTKIWEEKWTAWLFQVISALCVAQTLFGLTHNDLHTNNIVWSHTEEKYLYYRSNTKKVFRVPTYGKLFKIIDFGRSIFSINEHLFVSDDFKEGNDAATQYNFEPLVKKDDKENSVIIPPNPSFDLARLAISLFENLFPEMPDEKKDGTFLSREKGRVVKETKSELYNMLWTWLLDKDNNNILWDESNNERFPDFGLYVHIASSCNNSEPKQQIYKKPFHKFMVEHVPKSAKVYQLYV